MMATHTSLQVQDKTTLKPATSFAPLQSGILQRKCACGGTPGIDGECAECRSKRLALQRQSAGQTGVSPVPSIVHDVLRSPGQPLDAGTRAFMEPRFGHDFSKVRLHTDGRAAESARAVNALAYTMGRDIVFGTGRYAPDSIEGRRLLAHELTHVVQQNRVPNSGGLQEKLAIGQPDDSYEHEAETQVSKVIEGRMPDMALVKKERGIIRLQPTPPSGPSTSPPPACNPKRLDVTRIPNVMDAKGWRQGAALLREWFANPPGGGQPDARTITMDWVLGFSRAKKQYDSIFKDKVYANKSAQAEIARLLKRLGSDKGGTFNFARPVTELNPDYDINFRTVGSTTDPLDGLTAALGKFTFRVVVGGRVEKEKGKDGAPDRFKVSITDVGVHVRDSFDFNGSQSLGCWNVCTNDVGRVFCGGVYVTNGDFRNFRETHRRGGDFTVLSDVRATHLSSPEIFYLQ